MSHKINIDELLEIYRQTNNKSEAARQYATRHNLNYTSSFRRKISNYIKTEEENQNTTLGYFDEDETVSALNVDGSIMTIDEYCDFYGLDKLTIKSWKLITHTNKPYYNIVSKTDAGAYQLSDFKDKLIKSIEEVSTRPKTIYRTNKYDDPHLLVIDPADIHIGKLSTKAEVGEFDEYNAEIAIRRVHEGVDGILDKVNGFNIDQVLFVAGNDILHTDTIRRTTTANTPQDTDGMWYENFLKAKQLYIEIIDKLLDRSNVHFMFNPSNHDYMTGFLLADVIKTYYKDCENITFDTSMSYRKYYTYHDNLIGTTHGDGGKAQDLPLAMAHESKDWSNTRHRYVYTHHVHHKTSKDYMSVNVESLRSASGADSWHHQKQFQHAPKAIEGFLHHPKNGQIARITHIF